MPGAFKARRGGSICARVCLSTTAGAALVAVQSALLTTVAAQLNQVRLWTFTQKSSADERQRSASMATSEAPAAVPVGTWKPRWRQSGAGPSVKFYTTSEISTAFDCPCNHTFITGRPGPVEGEITETEAPPVLLVMNHLKANPNAPTELWTRNSFPSISRSLHSVVPFFSESTVMRRKYELTGWFELERAELVKGGSEAAKAFVMAREESKGVKSPEAWASALRDVRASLL